MSPGWSGATRLKLKPVQLMWQSGVKRNAGKEKGVILLDGNKCEFKVCWSKTYHCFRGGKPRLKPEVKNPLKRQNAPGSRRIICPAQIRTWLIVTTASCSLLEVSVLDTSWHKGHDLLCVPDKLCQRMLPRRSRDESEITRYRGSPPQHLSQACTPGLGEKRADTCKDERRSAAGSTKSLWPCLLSH